MNNDYKKIAFGAVKQAGQMLIREYERFDRSDINLKSYNEIVTKADLMSEEIIIRQLKRNFPTHGIISEEAGDLSGQAEYVWYLDPIDGTTNFSMHNPLWSISLALTQAGQVIFGIVYAPMLEEIFVAELGKGAEVNGEKIKVSAISGGKIINTYCYGKNPPDVKRAIAYYKKQKLNQIDCRQLGSAAIELAYVAVGRTESFVAPGGNAWDLVAGALLVKEAGGKVTDFSGRPWNLKMKDIVASNGKVHGQVLRILK